MIAAGTRVRVIASPGITGTLAGFFKPLPSGARLADVRWDDPALVMTVAEAQIEEEHRAP